MQVRGRHLVLAWTAVFIAVAALVIARDRRAYLVQRRVTNLSDHISALISDRDRLSATIARLSTQQELQPKAEALGLRIASDSEMVGLLVTPPR